MTLREIQIRLDIEWQNNNAKMRWSEMETTLVAILKLDNTDADAHDKVILVKDCIDAYTKRGHFST